MPVPALVGFSWLGTLLSSLFTGALAWFANYLSKRILIVTTIILAWGVAFAALKAGTIAVGVGASYALPTALMQHAGAVIPSNLGTFLAFWGSVEATVSIYKVTLRVLGYKAQVA